MAAALPLVQEAQRQLRSAALRLESSGKGLGFGGLKAESQASAALQQFSAECMQTKTYPCLRWLREAVSEKSVQHCLSRVLTRQSTLCQQAIV